jgi:BASS family bile acid:Na+ symporter
VVTAALRLFARFAMPISSAGILAGLIMPDLAAILRPVMEVFVVLLMTLAYSRLDWSGIRTISGKPLLTAMILLWVLAAVPGLSAAAGWALALPSVLLTAIILNAIAPPITSSVPFCQLLGLDAALALRVTLIATLLMPVTVPASILLLLGVTIDLDPGEFALRAAVFIGLPLALSWLIRRSPRLTARLNRGTEVDGITAFILMIIAIGIMDGVTARISAEPAEALAILAAAFGVSILFHGLSGLVFWRLGERTAISIALTSGSRNLVLMLVIIGDAMGPAFGLYVALGQVPIYLMPAIIQTVWRSRGGRTVPPA